MIPQEMLLSDMAKEAGAILEAPVTDPFSLAIVAPQNLVHLAEVPHNVFRTGEDMSAWFAIDSEYRSDPVLAGVRIYDRWHFWRFLFLPGEDESSPFGAWRVKSCG